MCGINATQRQIYSRISERIRRISGTNMLHVFAVTHPIMVIAIAVLCAFYFTGVYLLVSSLSQEPEWFEDENGELHHFSSLR
jgi:hypothetical protein